MPRASSSWDWRKHARAVTEAQSRASAAFEAFKRAGRTAAGRTAWEHACAALEDTWQAAWPPGFWDAFKALDGPEIPDLSVLISFLEADPVFFRSGYVAESILRKLRRQPLDETDKAKLRTVVLDAVSGRHRRQFRRYGSLARDLDTPDLRVRLRDLARNADVRVSNHAVRVLDSLEQADRMRK